MPLRALLTWNCPVLPGALEPPRLPLCSSWLGNCQNVENVGDSPLRSPGNTFFFIAGRYWGWCVPPTRTVSFRLTACGQRCLGPQTVTVLGATGVSLERRANPIFPERF